MLVEEVKKSILNTGYKAGDKLPSVRDMAHRMNLSTGTILKIYKDLIDEGFVKSYAGKGYFWGGITVSSTVQPESVESTLEALFTKDLENGYLNAFDKLPSIKEFAIRYKTSLYHIRNFLNMQVEKGVLKHIGTKFYFDSERVVKNANYILFVHRADKRGRFLIDSEREMEVFRVLAQFAADQKISIHFVGYYEDGDRLLLPDGSPFVFNDSAYCLGAFVSTWLIYKPSVMFAHFSRFSFPISVWWEYSGDDVPVVTKSKNKWAFFNLAFGKETGVIVGKHLLQNGIKQAHFVSPFHLSDWSKMRLQGLQDSGVDVIALVSDKMSSPYDVDEAAAREHADPAMFLNNTIKRLLEQKTLKVLVCSNDLVAARVIDILEELKEPRPYIVGFDNTAESYRYVFDSFAFNVEAMVKEALYHIISPSVYSMFRRQVQNPLGKVVVKE